MNTDQTAPADHPAIVSSGLKMVRGRGRTNESCRSGGGTNVLSPPTRELDSNQMGSSRRGVQNNNRPASFSTGREIAMRAPHQPPSDLAVVLPGANLNDHWIETLDNGPPVLIRPLRAKDHERELQFIHRLPPEIRQSHFLNSFGEPDDFLMSQMMDEDNRSRFAYVALAHVDGELREIGISRYAAGPDDTTCECAVIVADDWQRRGLGRRLMTHLIDAARDNGFKTMKSIDLSNHYAIHRLLKTLGFHSRYPSGNFSEIIHELTL
jgi:GNAT superfamily N-acetyltransferase